MTRVPDRRAAFRDAGASITVMEARACTLKDVLLCHVFVLLFFPVFLYDQ